LIDTIALLHQHQREVKAHQRPGHDGQIIEYIEVRLTDIELANRIAHDVLGRSLDELPPQTRRLLRLIDAHVSTQCACQAIRRSDFRFSRRVLREAINWGDTQLRLHLERLVEFEYVLTHREGPGGKYLYELAYEVRDDARAQVAGLIDADALAALAARDPAPAVAKSRGQAPEVAGRLRGECGPVAAKSRGGESAAMPASTGGAADQPSIDAEIHCSGPTRQRTSYAHSAAVPAAASLAAAQA
jgi:hypothetical protein